MTERPLHGNRERHAGAKDAGGAAPGPRESALHRLLEDDDPDQVPGRFLGELSRLVPFDWALLTVPSGEDRARTRCWRTARSGPGGLDECAPPGDWRVPDLSRANRPTPLDPALLVGIPRSENLSQVLGVSVPMRGDSRASLFLGRKSSGGFPAEALSTAAPLWPAFGRALDRVASQRRADRISRESSSELSALFDIVRTSGRALEFEDLFLGTCTALQPVIGVDQIAVLLDIDGRRSLTFYLARPFTRGLRRDLMTRCLEAFRRESGREVRIAEPVERTLSGFDPKDPEASRNPELFETVTMRCRGRAVGLIAVIAERGRLTGAMSRMLSAAAGQASLTVDRLQEGAEAQARRLGAVIDSMSDGVVVTDDRFRVETLNPAAREHLLILTGRTHPEALDDLGGIRLAEIADEVVSGRRASASVEVRVTDPRRILRLTVTSVSRGRGNTAGLVIVTSDITEARALQEQMIQTEKLSALGEMISGVAHELNNPLASVMGYAQLLQSARVRKEVKQRLETIASEARRCQNIVRNLLTFARKHRPETRAMSVNEAVESVLALLAYQLRVDGIELRMDLDPSLPPVSGDFHQLQQVILNLVTNAQQAMKPSDRDKWLCVRTLADEGTVRVEIEDSGPGIAPDLLGRIFEPFFTTKEVGKGTGLGLSISRNTVRAHGGDLLVDSEPGCGTRFSMTLPASHSHARRDRREEHHGAGPLPSRSILVVEDESSVSRFLRDTLVADGHRVDTAADGGEARLRLARRDYDLIITDLRMPRVGGRELYEQVSAERPEIARRFIFATGDVLSGDAKEFFERTGRPVLAKPFDVGDLRRLIHDVLREG